MPLYFLKKYRYGGAIYPINPNYREIDGLPCLPSLAEVPGPIDLAVLAVPADSVVTHLSSCPRGRIGSALVLSSGYAEAGPEGEQRQEALRKTAAQFGIRVLGPNSVGCVNLWDGVVPSISQVFDMELAPGSIALVTQSGALGTAMTALANRAGLRVGFFVSTGNEADLEFSDICAYLLEDPRVEVIAGYLEGIRGGRKFVHVARRARELGKPLIVLKVGRSDVGRAAARSHTGALVGSYDTYRAVFERFGVVEARSMDELLDLTKVFSAFRRFGGSRAAILTHSGGMGVMMADACASAGLGVPRMADGVRARLRARLPAYAAVDNPVDMTASIIFQPETMVGCLRDCLESDGIDAGFLGVNLMWRVGPRLADELVQLRRSQPKPFAVAWVGIQDDLARRLQQERVPVYEDPDRCVAAVAAAVRWSGNAADADTELPALPRVACEARTYREQARLLAGYGVPLADWRLVTGVDEAVHAAGALGYPLVAKAISPLLSHKSDVGGVVLGIRDEAQLRSAVERLLAILPGRTDDCGVLLQRQITGGLEILVGGHCDPTFGPVVAVGPGGLYVETFRQVRLLLAPVDAAAVRRALERAPWFDLLRGARGEPPRDVEALTELVHRVSRLMAELEVESLDLNPVMVLPAGCGVVAVDFRLFAAGGAGAH